MAYKVFISYSTKDIRLVTSIAHQLTTIGVNIFLAEYSIQPGEDIDQKILQNLSNSDVFLLILSKNSKSSDYVNQEIGIAKTRRLPILPLAVEPIEPPTIIRSIKHLPLYKEPERCLEWLKKHLVEGRRKKELWIAVGVAIGVGVLLWVLASSKK